ncbi:glycosyltransferase [Pontibacter sp. G13]|uniref:glycosyltransferase family 4 protein n=1 Tax=Pontibacter sp. G13 TaxID=3074898 RepID=UPI002889221B|nr:glycosyltransferase [Pontibacter sp. G13]WNJ19758.1 glycosyltransferase [Pontibacter sp. G13]
MDNQTNLIKIAWTTNAMLLGAANHLNKQQAQTGTWLDTLFNQIRKEFAGKAKFYAIHGTEAVKQVVRYEEDDVVYILYPRKKYSFLSDFKHEIDSLEVLMREIEPDLVHIHGTEDFYGLIAERMPELNIVASLQGIREQIDRMYFAEMSKWEYIWRNIRKAKINWFHLLVYRSKMVKVEQRILRKINFFIGRTDFDRAHSLGRNPKATYFGDCHDILRPDFLTHKWDVKNAEPFTIHTTLSANPFKGIFLMLETVKILALQFPQVKLRIAGGMVGMIGKHAQEYVKKNGLTKHVEFLGRCNGEQLVSSLMRSRVATVASYIENESLSLQEAQAVGVPVISTYAGGMPSMIQQGETGFQVPTGDPYYMAAEIAKLFQDDELSSYVGDRAWELIRTRNDADVIGGRYREIYTKLLNRDKEVVLQSS